MYEWELPKDRFEGIRLIAKSAEGCVYKAFDKQWWTYVIAKRLNAAYWEKDFEYRLIRQVKALRRLEHRSIVKYFECITNEDKGAVWIIYEYYSGEVLIDRLQKYPNGLPEKTALRIFIDILEGIEYAHKQGVIHRDLKATNIILRSEDESAVIIDFGLATTTEERGGTMDVSAGTPYYMSPEQFISLRETDQRTDIWALGCLLQQMLTETLPFGTPPDQPMLVYDRVLNSQPKIPDNINEELKLIISHSLEKDKNKRLYSAKEFLRLIKIYESMV